MPPVVWTIPALVVVGMTPSPRLLTALLPSTAVPFTIVSQGDCIDSNGALTINGGTLDLTCNSTGNTALDTDGTYSNNGGSITTNDGSESNPGSMGSGGRAGGQMKNMRVTQPLRLPSQMHQRKFCLITLHTGLSSFKMEGDIS